MRPKAATTLRDLYQQQAAATAATGRYLAGVCDALGIDPARLSGFDDATGELILDGRVDDAVLDRGLHVDG